MSGIPEGLETAAPPPVAAPTAVPTAPAPAPAPAPVAPVPGAQPGTGSPLDFMRQSPEFQQMRQMVQSNPQLLQPLLQQYQRTHPEIVELITQHQEEFMRMLAEDVGGGMPGGMEGGPQVVQVSPEDRAALERLMGLGFSQPVALQAYLACDRNEEIAANYLLEHGAELEGDAMDEGGQ
mmetsp:Transcript_12081/g.28371  ORF Transcript_12081/g.28371 Transcript_12081/m.28371 type:complete len:179 (+) Transcript_12081:585-1121(+)